VEITPIHAKKKVGRPRKIQAPIVANDDEPQDPLHTSIGDSHVEFAGPVKESPFPAKKKVGRPRKIRAPIVANDDEPQDPLHIGDSQVELDSLVLV
jgi:hypothetical protein